jgi:hypothetical protein
MLKDKLNVTLSSNNTTTESATSTTESATTTTEDIKSMIHRHSKSFISKVFKKPGNNTEDASLGYEFST